jgi:hypothetical protein
MRPIQDRFVELEMREVCTGFFTERWVRQHKDWEKDFRRFGVALKQRVESLAIPHAPALAGRVPAPGPVPIPMPLATLEPTCNTSLQNLHWAMTMFSASSSTNDQLLAKLGTQAIDNGEPTENMESTDAIVTIGEPRGRCRGRHRNPRPSVQRKAPQPDKSPGPKSRKRWS